MSSRLSVASPIGSGDQNELKEIHVKMSKKIAQLTKVIYQLNTKNEDNDQKIKYLTDKHTQQLEELKANGRPNQEDFIELSKFTEIQKEKTLMDQNYEELNKKFRSVMDQKRELEIEKNRLVQVDEQFQTSKSKWDLERKRILADIEKKGSNENNTLTEMISSLKSDLAHQRDLSEKEIGSLRIRITNMKAENVDNLQKADRDYGEKTDKLKGLHSREIKLLKGETEEKQKQISEIQKQNAKFEKQIEVQQKEINRLSRDLKETKRSYGEDRKEKTELNTLLDELNKEQELLRNQLATSNIQRSQVESKLNHTIAQLEDKTRQNEKQHTQMIEKISKISELEGSISEMELALNSANTQLGSLETKLNQTESSKNRTHNEASKKIQDLTLDLNALREKHQATVEKHAVKALELEAALKNAQKYRQEDGDAHAKKLVELEAHHAALAAEIKRNLEHEFETEKENINKIHSSTLENERTKHNTKLAELNIQLADSRNKHDEEMARSQKQLDELKNMLESHSDQNKNKNSEIEYYKNREKELESYKVELGSEITKMNEIIEKLKKEIEDYRIQISNEEAVKKLREDKIFREATQAERLKWEAELGKQLEILRRDLSSRLQKEREIAIENLMKQKNEEIAASKRGLQDSIQKMASQNAKLKLDLSQIEKDNNSELNRIRMEHAEETSNREKMLSDMNLRHSKEMALLERTLKQETQMTEERLIQERRDEIDSVETKFREESMKLMESQRISINALKAKLEENQERQLKQVETEHQDALDLLQIRLEEHHQAELDEQAKRQEQEFLELENQLEHEKMQRKQLTDNLEEEIEMYKLKLQGANNQIEKNSQQTKNQIKENQTLIMEIERQRKEYEGLLTSKDNDMDSMKKDFENDKENCVNEAIADGLRRRQNMLSDFNKAQDLLKGKINDISSERDDFEQKYLSRESRPEDTEMIEHLNLMIKEKESALNQLEEEMKFYQLELVNREQNYNSMFSSNPQVGLLDPLNAKPAGNSKSSTSLRNPSRTQVIQPRASRFADHFIRMEPSILADHLPQNRLEPIQSKRTVR